MLRVFADARCLQDPGYALRGVGLHSSVVLRHARRFIGRPIEMIGITDPLLPALSSDYESLFDTTRHIITPSLRPTEEAIFVQTSPMTHCQERMAAILGRPRIFAVSIIYDFIPLDVPERYLATRDARRRYFEACAWLKNYHLFCPISHYSGRRLSEVVGTPPRAIEMTGAAVRQEFSGFRAADADRVTLKTRFARGSYFLVVGGDDPRKNVECVLSAHAAMRRESPDGAAAGRQSALVVVGHYGRESRARLEAVYTGTGGRLRDLEFISGVSDAELATLYHFAIATIAPSKIEGFSLPCVEAVASGCPVLASDCDAQRELIPQPDAQFHCDDVARVARLMSEVLSEPSRRESLWSTQQPVVARYTEDAVAGKFWRRTAVEFDAFRRARSASRARLVDKPRIAYLTPMPPDRSGVAEYSAQTFASLGRLATVDVFTEQAAPKPTLGVRKIEPLTAYPYLSGEYDRVIAVVGNSHFHWKTMELLGEYGGACLEHDNRLLELYAWMRGPHVAAAMATRALGRTVEVPELQSWLADPEKMQSLYFEELLRMSDPFIVHSRGIQAQVKKRHGLDVSYLPFCCYRPIADEALAVDRRRAARKRLGIPPDRIAIITLGQIVPSKGPAECIWALDHLLAWGVPADLYFVGSAEHWRPQVEEMIDRAGVRGHVHVPTEWISEELYVDYLLAADYAIQLRTHTFGGLSGAVMDCISAGLPCVSNRDLADSMESPDFVLRVPDHLSATLIAEQICECFQRGLHETRFSEGRTRYLGDHSFTTYASLMMKVLKLD